LQTAGLLDKISAQTAAYAGSYFGVRADEIIVAPGLGTRSGIVGAFELAKKALNVEDRR
jgi:hypothetical protein